MKNSYITGTDLFCGAGGSSTGAILVPGVEIRTAVNHWQLALETHNQNHPNVDHVLTDISTADPYHFPSTTFLWASPECTNHSLAKGHRRVCQVPLPGFGEKGYDPSAERSRVTMWDVVRFTEVHKYEFIIVENVVDARKWVLFDSWANAMHALDYELETVYLNSQFAPPTPQSRDRLYCVFWKTGNHKPDLDIRPPAYCTSCEREIEAVQSWKKDWPWGRYRVQYVYCCPLCASEVEPHYNPAWSAIDWSLEPTIIAERKRPLSERTMARIRYGLEKYAQEPLVIELAHGGHHRRAYPASRALPTQTRCQTLGLAVPPFLMSYYTRDSAHSRLDEAMPTVTTENRHALVIPPFIAELRRTGKARSILEPLSTVSAGGTHHALIIPFLIQYYGRMQTSSTAEAMPTITTKDRHALIIPADAAERCGFRMLQPHELQVGMGFPGDYMVLGNKREQVRQLGNAVTPPAAQILVERCVQSLN